MDYAVKHRHVEIVDTGLKFGREGLPRYREHRFGPQMNLAKRFYPHTHNMEGFFIVKLRKVSNGPKLPKKIATSPGKLYRCILCVLLLSIKTIFFIWYKYTLTLGQIWRDF